MFDTNSSEIELDKTLKSINQKDVFILMYKRDNKESLKFALEKYASIKKEKIRILLQVDHKSNEDSTDDLGEQDLGPIKAQEEDMEFLKLLDTSDESIKTLREEVIGIIQPLIRQKLGQV